MPMQALEQFEKRIKLFEQMIGKNIEKRVRLFEEKFEQKVERPFRRIEQKIGRNIETRIRRFEQKNGVRLDDEVRFIGSWIKKPLAVGAVTPSGKVLARTHGALCRSEIRPGRWSNSAPAPGRSPRRWSSMACDPARLVLVEFNPTFCQLLRQRFPAATVVQGDAYGCATRSPHCTRQSRRRSCPACR